MKLYIKVVGDLDASSALDLDNVIKEALDEKRFEQIIFKCDDLDYISSAGVGVFISHHDEAKDQACEFKFEKMNERVFDVFKVLGLDDIFNIEGDIFNPA